MTEELRTIIAEATRESEAEARGEHYNAPVRYARDAFSQTFNRVLCGRLLDALDAARAWQEPTYWDMDRDCTSCIMCEGYTDPHTPPLVHDETCPWVLARAAVAAVDALTEPENGADSLSRPEGNPE